MSLVHGRRIQRREAHVEAAHHLVGDRRPEEPDGRTDAGIDRHDDPLDPELFRNPAGMEGCCPAEGDDGLLRGDLAFLDGQHPRRIGHVLIDDLDDSLRRLRRPELQRSPTLPPTASAESPGRSSMRPPAKPAGSIRPRTMSAS